MINIILDVIFAVGIFGAGVYVGEKFPINVAKAIAAIEAAEKSAQATIAKIIDHKAS
jgi:hypothetical protein